MTFTLPTVENKRMENFSTPTVETERMEKFPTLTVGDPNTSQPAPKEETIDWQTQVPKVINDSLSEAIKNIQSGDEKYKPNAYDLASLWFGDTIANTPNLSRAYTDTMNTFLSGINQIGGNTNTLLNSIMSQYGNLSNNVQGSYNNYATLGSKLGQGLQNTQNLADLSIYKDLLSGVNNYQDMNNLNSYQGLLQSILGSSTLNNMPSYNTLLSQLQNYPGLQNTSEYQSQSNAVDQSRYLSSFGSYQDLLNSINQYKNVEGMGSYQDLTGNIEQNSDLNNYGSYQDLLNSIGQYKDLGNLGSYQDLLNSIGQYKNVEGMGSYQDLTGNIEQNSDLNNFGSYQDLLNSIGQYKDLGNLGSYQGLMDLASAQGLNLDDLNALISRIDPDYSGALNQQLNEYGGLQNQGAGLNQNIIGNREQIGNISDVISNNILNSYQNVLTGQVTEASQKNIDQIFQSNLDLVNQAFDERLERERRQLVDEMGGRGILTSGVTGRAYGDIVDSALSEKQKNVSEIAAQRASAMLELPFRQAQQANALNEHGSMLNNLTTSETNDLINILQTQYGMSKDNAALAIQNFSQKYNSEIGARQLGTQAQGQLQALLQGVLGTDVQNQQAIMQLLQGTMNTDAQNQQAIMQLQQGTMNTDAQNQQAIMQLLQGVLGTDAQNQQAIMQLQQGAMNTDVQNQQQSNQILQQLFNSVLGNNQAIMQLQQGAMNTDVQNTQQANAAGQALLQLLEQSRQNQLTQEQNLLGQELQNTQYNIGAQQNLVTTEAQVQQNALQTLYNMMNSQAQNTQINQAAQNQLFNSLIGYDTNTQATLAGIIAQQGSLGNQNLQLQQQIAQSAPDAMAKMFDQYGALSQSFLKQLLDREMNALNADTSLQVGLANANARQGSSSGGFIESILGSSGICVRKGTSITMADGSLKLAEHIKSGDKIRSFDVNLNQYVSAEVDTARSSVFNYFYEVTLMDGSSLDVSSYHPFLVYTGKGYTFNMVGYFHVLRNVVKHLFKNPFKFIDNIKYIYLSLFRYGKLKSGKKIMCDNYNNVMVGSIVKKNVKDVFFNFRLSPFDYPTFIANGMVVEALYEESEKFTNWISEEGTSFDV